VIDSTKNTARGVKTQAEEIDAVEVHRKTKTFRDRDQHEDYQLADRVPIWKSLFLTTYEVRPAMQKSVTSYTIIINKFYD
jgi:hypothetical protein